MLNYFCFRKKEELTKIGSSYLKELQLYRNANSSNVERICINGFGQGAFDVHSTNGMRETLYFAKEADVANRGNTMNRCGGYYMILCRVLVTVASGMLENVNMISEMNGTNGFQDYSIVPVRDYDRVYPEFVIMFTVWNGVVAVSSLINALPPGGTWWYEKQACASWLLFLFQVGHAIHIIFYNDLKKN